MKKTVSILTLVLVLVSCSSYQKLLKNGNNEERFTAAKSYFLSKKYQKASTLLNDLVVANAFSGKKMEEAMYLLAESYLGNKDYYSASDSYAEYIKSFPRDDSSIFFILQKRFVHNRPKLFPNYIFLFARLETG